jgi:hypothetical protein
MRLSDNLSKLIAFREIIINPWNHRKNYPPRHHSQYIGSTLDVVYRKVVEASITFAIGS